MVDGDDTRISDETLIGRTAAGDRSAFERLVRRHQAAVFRFTRALAHDDTDAEAALHETFLSAWRAAGRFRYDASARTWLLSIARHAIYRRHRRWSDDDPALFVSLRELGEKAGWGVEDESFVDRLVDPEVLAGALASLSPEDREILILRELEGLSDEEAAGVAGLTEGAARTRLHRARLRMMTHLRQDPGDRRSDRRPDRIIAGLHCGEVLAELTAFLDGGLPPDRAHRIQEHVKECEDCERFGSEFSAAVFALREILSKPARDAEVEARLLERLRTEIA